MVAGRVILLCLFLPAAALPAGIAPVRLDVTTGARSVPLGQAVSLHVALLDANGRSAPAPKAFLVQLQLRTPANAVIPLKAVTIPPGSSSAEVSVPLTQPGLLYVWARNPELLPGGQFVNVRQPAPEAPAPQAERRREVRLPAAPAPPPPSPSVAPAPGARTVPRVLAPSPAPAGLPEITLRYSPQRDLLANGADPAGVEAFLVGDIASAPSDIRLNLFDSSNSLSPTPLVIRAGQSTGRSTVTASEPGNVTVEYISSNPRVVLDGGNTLRVHFVPPISKLSLSASPPRISLVDTAEIVVSLADASGRNWNSEAERHVSLTLTSGRGQLSVQALTIPAGQFEARTKFVPQMPGTVTIAASTPNLLTVAVPLIVNWPLALLICSIGGGAIGGFLSRKTRGRRDKWRVPTGLFTGFLLYWACIFLGLASLLGPAVLNPLSALAISAVGGWLQTEVFTIVADLIRPRAEKGA